MSNSSSVLIKKDVVYIGNVFLDTSFSIRTAELITRIGLNNAIQTLLKYLLMLGLKMITFVVYVY